MADKERARAAREHWQQHHGESVEAKLKRTNPFDTTRNIKPASRVELVWESATGKKISNDAGTQSDVWAEPAFQPFSDSDVTSSDIWACPAPDSTSMSTPSHTHHQPDLITTSSINLSVTPTISGHHQQHSTQPESNRLSLSLSSPSFIKTS